MDLNADLGEGFGIWRLGDDEGLLEVITSANVACGFHGGDPATMRRVCATATERGVAVGAQVGYRDLAGFGRRPIGYAFEELRDDLIYQIGALDAFCRVAGTSVRYVKPHGALYNTATADEVQAAAVVAAVADYDRTLPVLCLPGSALAQLAAGAGLRPVGEGFPDRGYQPNGCLVPRSAPGALVTSPTEVVARAIGIAVERSVVAVDGSVVSCPAESICLHGDSPAAVRAARQVRTALTEAGVRLTPFTQSQ